MNPALIIIAAYLFVSALEKFFPRTKLPPKDGWYIRAVVLNMVQLLIVLGGHYTWEKWLEGPSLFKLPWTPFYNGLFAYLINTWIFYWYHFVRHENNLLWLTLHQVHHSPVRIEVMTSFYKHPLEVLLNSWIITILICPILGLDNETNKWLVVFSALSEFFYHMNVATPYWVGYFMQRPEMHLAHHSEDRQFTCNYGDLPIWDLLGGTWINPKNDQIKTGFTRDRERKMKEMIFFQNVLPEKPKKLPRKLWKYILMNLLFMLGALNLTGMIFHSPELRGIAVMTMASPLPFVFTSYNDVETFSTTFTMDVTFKNRSQGNFILDQQMYSKLKGPYQRRNVIGAIFSHGPFFDNPQMIQIREQILDWGFCRGHLAHEFGIHDPIGKVLIEVRSKTIGMENEKWELLVQC